MNDAQLLTIAASLVATLFGLPGCYSGGGGD